MTQGSCSRFDVGLHLKIKNKKKDLRMQHQNEHHFNGLSTKVSAQLIPSIWVHYLLSYMFLLGQSIRQECVPGGHIVGSICMCG